MTKLLIHGWQGKLVSAHLELTSLLCYFFHAVFDGLVQVSLRCVWDGIFSGPLGNFRSPVKHSGNNLFKSSLYHTNS